MADNGTPKIKVNPNQVSDQMGRPVFPKKVSHYVRERGKRDMKEAWAHSHSLGKQGVYELLIPAAPFMILCVRAPNTARRQKFSSAETYTKSPVGMIARLYVYVYKCFMRPAGNIHALQAKEVLDLWRTTQQFQIYRLKKYRKPSSVKLSMS